MQFVLDFDRVVFDTDAFQTRLQEVGLCEISRGPALVEAVNEQRIDWTTFVRPGVVAFLKQCGHDVVIVSSYISRYRQDNQNVPADLEYFQREKIRCSGISDLVSKVVLVGESKLSALETLRQSDQEQFFLDDEPEHVQAAITLGYTAILFRTPKNSTQAAAMLAEENGMKGSVNSFDEFVALVDSWKPRL